MPNNPDDRELGRQEFKDRLLAHLQTEADHYSRNPDLHSYIEDLITEVKGWYK